MINNDSSTIADDQQRFGKTAGALSMFSEHHALAPNSQAATDVTRPTKASGARISVARL
jgi:hypothetical protein